MTDARHAPGIGSHGAVYALASVAYVLACVVGEQFHFHDQQIWLLWPAEGVILGMIYASPRRYWAGIIAATGLTKAVFTFLVQGMAAAAALGVLMSDVLDLVLGTYLLARFVDDPKALFTDPTSTYRFILLVPGAVMATTALVGTAVLAQTDHLPFFPLWLSWWISNALGVLVFAPFASMITRLVTGDQAPPTRAKLLEFALVGIVGALLLEQVFIGDERSVIARLEYLVFVPLLWTSLRLGVLETSIVLVAMSFFPILASVLGTGPYATEDKLVQVPMYQLFVAVTATSFLVIAVMREKERTLGDQLRVFTEGLERAVAERTQALERAKEDAVSANLAKSQFLANMSHEIRTPMNAILGFSEVLKRRETNPESRHFLEAIHASGAGLLSLIDDILDLSKVEAGKLELHYAPVCLQALTREIEVMFASAAEDKGLTLERVCNAQLPGGLMLDELRLRQVLINLVGNALKFTPHGFVRLTVASQELGHDGDYVALRLTVEDSGIGISEDQQAKIFAAFEQADGTIAAAHGGTGLGLAISRRLVQQMGGELRVRSAVGRGAAFVVDLPSVAVAAVPAAVHTLTEERVRFRDATILVVDDVAHNRDLVRTYLSGHDVRVVEADTWDVALARAQGDHPDLILLDMKMPEVDGYEVARRLKEAPATAEIPIVALTASAMATDVERLQTLGAAFLAKPVSWRALAQVLKRYVPHDDVPTTEGDAAIADPAASASLAGPRPPLPRVLVVEDDPANRMLIGAMLGALSELLVAEDGESAVRIAADHELALVLMDLHLPGMSGLEATRAIRALPEAHASRVPILGISADPWQEIAETCLEAGMDGGLSKPFDQAGLERALRRHARRSGER